MRRPQRSRQRCRVVRPNLRGTVKSERVDGPYLMERLAADVAAVLDALGIERAAVAGHSLGGYVAMAFARMFAERVSRIALICSRLAADTPEQAAARRDLADRVERENSVQPSWMRTFRACSRRVRCNRGRISSIEFARSHRVFRRRAQRRFCAEWRCVRVRRHRFRTSTYRHGSSAAVATRSFPWKRRVQRGRVSTRPAPSFARRAGTCRC